MSNKKAALDPVIWARARQVLNAGHRAGLEMDEKNFIKLVHIRPKINRRSLCGKLVHPANADWYSPGDATCPECKAKYEQLVLEEGRSQLRNYWGQPNAGAAVAPAEAPVVAGEDAEWEQPSLF